MSLSHNLPIRLFGLRRLTTENEPLWIEHVLEWTRAEFRDPSYWENFEIRRGDVKICDYTVSAANHLYITSHINIELLPLPRMKHRDMIVDNWRATGEELASLRSIATMFITNEAAMGCIREAFEARGQHGPNSPGWEELVTGNPFVEGQIKMLGEYRNEFNRARIRRITVAVHERTGLFDMHVMNMVTHFTGSTGRRRDNRTSQPASQPESSRAGPSQDNSQGSSQQHIPQGVQFSNWIIGPY
ncbi:hypothetical protein F5B19DRAFT_494256 [Rostrohypoxylon terebratum]|nr:hypothetical protein F5B19DRAFT_494256 [Rostrohypoxylon terebratum]